MVNLVNMTTESRNEKTVDLDIMTPLEIATIMNKEDENVILAIRNSLNSIADAIEICANTLRKGGRIVYAGAGTSGRLGLLDAVECPPTFGVSSELVVGLLAGGQSAFVKAVEGAEDSKTLGEKELKDVNLNCNDILVGIAASGRTPYVVYGMEYARRIGCKTICIVCNRNSEMSRLSDISIELIVGPEVLTGSTRLKAGSAQKMVLNMISTGAMVGVGKVYKNLMVDVKQTNEKLVSRAQNIVIEATGTDRETAIKALKEANGKAKTAIVMILLNCSADEADEKIDKANGHIREAIKNN